MQNFVFHTPTKVFFGKDTHKNVGKIIKEYGFKKVLLHYGGASLKRSGTYDQIIKSLNESNVNYIELPGVQPNPTLSMVRDGIRLCKSEKIDFILAAGGGSVIDSAKEIAVGSACDTDVWEFFMKKPAPNKSIPMGTILTIAASGSEMSSSAVISNEETKEKRGYNSEFHRPLFSILNPELTYSLPQFQTACGVCDILMHTIERYFSNTDDVMITDSIAEAVLKTTIANGRIVYRDPTNYEARANIMWASSLSHNDLTGAGKNTMLAVHQFEHDISGLYPHVTHGAGLSVMLPAWMKFVYKARPSKFARFAVNVFGINPTGKSDEELSVLGIDEIWNYFSELSLPHTFCDLGIDNPDIEKLSLMCSHNKTRTLDCIVPIGYEEMKKIFQSVI